MLRHRLPLFDEWFNRRNAKCSDASYKQKGDTKRSENEKDETNENDDTEDSGSTEDEYGDVQGSNTHNEQDSYISFENDTDDEIDTTAIEAEEWLENLEKEAQTKPLKRWRMRSFDVGSRLK